ncbi:MAG: ATP-dependent RNA helicase DbpA [Pseudomonadales bacterium]
MPSTSNPAGAFAQLALQPQLLSNLATLGYHEMTPIQAQSLPLILAGKDVIGQGKTGSGKTAAFGLGLLNKLDIKLFRIQALVLCPTRELADQVAREIRRLARAVHNIKVLTLCGGTPFGPQLGSLEHGAHIIVGTPGRIEEHLRKGSLKLNDVNTLVLDEADRMLSMGFQDSLDAIVAGIPNDRQSLMFSATYPQAIASMAERIMRDPGLVQLAEANDTNDITQHFYCVADDAARAEATAVLLLKYQPASALVFCNTRQETANVANGLHQRGFSALALHGDMEQKARDQTLLRFANRSISVLVATDVAARGIDIDALDLVINYQLARDPEVHVHRVGRTGRAGSSGRACSLFTQAEARRLDALQMYIDSSIKPEPLPDKNTLAASCLQAEMVTLQIDGGKKQKLRAGDILGALTSKEGPAGNAITGSDVGKIVLHDIRAYVAVKRQVAQSALQKIQRGKMKGRNFKVRQLR